jgi:hypothetical protein
MFILENIPWEMSADFIWVGGGGFWKGGRETEEKWNSERK